MRKRVGWVCREKGQIEEEKTIESLKAHNGAVSMRSETVQISKYSKTTAVILCHSVKIRGSHMGYINVVASQTSGTEPLSCTINLNEWEVQSSLWDKQMWMRGRSMTSSFWEEKWVSHPACLPLTSLPPNSCSMIIHFHIILDMSNIYKQDLHLPLDFTTFCANDENVTSFSN